MYCGEKQRNAVKTCEMYRRQGYACSESVVRALADEWNLELPEDFLREMSIFAGGAAEDGRCGVLEAGLAIMANLYVSGFFGEEASIQELSGLLHREFERTYQGYLCSEIFYPLYEQHQKSNLTEEDFFCAFHGGILIIMDFFMRKRKQGGEVRL